jgi:hypothetical protein
MSYQPLNNQQEGAVAYAVYHAIPYPYHTMSLILSCLTHQSPSKPYIYCCVDTLQQPTGAPGAPAQYGGYQSNGYQAPPPNAVVCTLFQFALWALLCLPQSISCCD